VTPTLAPPRRGGPGWTRWAAALLVPAVAWSGLALWFSLPPVARWWLVPVWGALVLPGLLAPWWPRRRERALLVAALACLVVLAGWLSLRPSHERPWADDVAKLLGSVRDGQRVSLRNVRNFDWRSEQDYTARWETREYDLDRLVSTDLVLSYWMGSHVAHTLVSFGFDDGRQLVFSAEIRRERDEEFSALGGFFRSYEAVLIAADEYDILRTRTNARGEDVYLYRLDIDRQAMRALFLGYLEVAEGIRRQPRFYNTLTSNCTTIIFDLARRLSPALPLDWRLLLSGHFARYAEDAGALLPGHDFEALTRSGRITGRARRYAGPADGFPQAIRDGMILTHAPGAPLP
jgi:hypothetical protein